MPARAPKRERLDTATIQGVRFFTRNFSGLAGKFNAKGRRKFSIRLDEDTARRMEKDGWYIKWLQPREGFDEPEQPILEVKVRFPAEGERGSIPRVYLITNKGKTLLREDMLPIVDWAEIDNVDLTIRAYHYDIDGKTGVSAYLKTVFIKIIEDELDLKYQDVPDTAQSAIVFRPDDEEPPWEE